MTMLIFKIFLVLFIIGFIFLMLLMAGETCAMDNKYPRFTIWWRKHVVGIEKDLDSHK
jgi:hypothetical protein